MGFPEPQERDRVQFHASLFINRLIGTVGIYYTANKMKINLKIGVWLLLTVFLSVSCKKDSEKTSIVGKWNLQQTIEWEFSNGSKIESTKKTYMLNADDGEWMTLEFTASGTVVSESKDDWQTGSYTISGTTLKVVFPGQTDVVNIKSVDKGSLILETEMTYPETSKIYWNEIHYAKVAK